MCTVSAVSGAFQHYVPQKPWAAVDIQDIKKIIALCEKIDRRLGEPDCIDPDKDEWMKSMEARLRALEARG